MKLRAWLTAFGTLALVGLLIREPLLTAQGPKSARASPEGFGGQYVLVEKKDGGFVMLLKPEVRTLGERTYLVGRTVPVPGVTDDELFAPLAQWVGLDDIRRMGEADSTSIVSELQNIAVRRRALQKTLASGAK
jgi:hypothetical protein